MIYSHDEFDYVKIIKIKKEVVARTLDYIKSLTYQTYSSKEKQNVERNSFRIIKLEAVKDGTLVWLQGFGKLREERYGSLKSFVTGLEKLLNEREKRK